MRWRIFIEYYRPEESIGRLWFGQLGEKIMLDYNVYFFLTKDLTHSENGAQRRMSLAEAKNISKYWKLSVYRNGEKFCFKMIGEQLV
jgi:hypothetical protein